MGKKALAELGKRLKRLFLGRIVVHEVGKLHRDHAPLISTHFRGIDTHPVRSTPRVGEALFVKWKQTQAKPAGQLIAMKTGKLGVKSAELGRFKRSQIKSFKPRFSSKLAAKDGMRRIKRLPHLRRNRLNFLKDPPRFANSSLLAVFSPIYQNRVKKSTLDKRSGRLHFWYDDSGGAFTNRSHLLLFRVFGGKDPLSWVWLSADKKIG